VKPGTVNWPCYELVKSCGHILEAGLWKTPFKFVKRSPAGSHSQGLSFDRSIFSKWYLHSQESAWSIFAPSLRQEGMHCITFKSSKEESTAHKVHLMTVQPTPAARENHYLHLTFLSILTHSLPASLIEVPTRPSLSHKTHHPPKYPSQ
jgi:hypothetical protein